MDISFKSQAVTHVSLCGSIATVLPMKQSHKGNKATKSLVGLDRIAHLPFVAEEPVH